MSWVVALFVVHDGGRLVLSASCCSVCFDCCFWPLVFLVSGCWPLLAQNFSLHLSLRAQELFPPLGRIITESTGSLLVLFFLHFDLVHTLVFVCSADLGACFLCFIHLAFMRLYILLYTAQLHSELEI